MIRTISFAAAIAAMAVGICAAADESPIKARKTLMKENGDQAKLGAAMAKGEAPFDLAKARKIFTTFEDTATKASVLWPDNSLDEATESDPFASSPKIWESMDDFKSRFVKFGDDAKAALGSVTDLDTFKAAFGNIGKNDCGGCHEKYRVKKS